MTERDNSSNPDHSSARQIRMFVLVIGVLSLAVVGGLISMVFFVSDEVTVHAVGPVPPGPGAERGGLVFKGTVGLWAINGRQTADASRRVHLDMELTGPSGQPPPPTLEMRWVIDLPDSGLPEIPVTPSRVGTGRYTGTAQLSADGQWRLRIHTPVVTGRLKFYVDPLKQ
jgi:hypothetical protein